MEKIVLRSPEGGTKQDLYSVLAQMIAAVSQDHAQLRLLIYEFARTRLRKDLYRQFEQLGWRGIAAQVLALEAAIDQVEADCANNTLLPPSVSEAALHNGIEQHSPQTALARRTDSRTALIFADDPPSEPRRFLGSSTYPVEHTWSPRRRAERDDRSATARDNKQSRSSFWWSIQLIAAVVLGLAIYAAIDGDVVRSLLGLNRPERSTGVDAANASKSQQNASPSARGLAAGSKIVTRTSIPGIPMPSAYGVYAVNNGQLIELDLLPIRVPDPRVAISAVISTPSRAHLPNGQLQFVIYRRDIAGDAPDRVSLRVVAQIVRALTFDSAGKPTVTNVEGSWAVRSNSYRMKVAPVPDNFEMIVIRPEHPEFIFPAGRYALVLKGVAYDFTLDGPLSDAAHCLERTDALNVPVYTECRSL